MEMHQCHQLHSRGTESGEDTRAPESGQRRCGSSGLIEQDNTYNEYEKKNDIEWKR